MGEKLEEVARKSERESESEPRESTRRVRPRARAAHQHDASPRTNRA